MKNASGEASLWNEKRRGLRILVTPSKIEEQSPAEVDPTYERTTYGVYEIKTLNLNYPCQKGNEVEEGGDIMRSGEG